MSAEAAFLAAIVDRPDDDHPRLLYADWLEEQGEAERSEFIRVQCELANRDLSVCTRCGDPWNSQVRKNSFPVPLAWCALCNIEGPPLPDVDFDAALRRRERELLTDDCRSAWFTVPKLGVQLEGDASTLYWWVQPEGPRIRGTIRRGFVEFVTCSWDAWSRHADALLAVAPITEVSVTDRPVVTMRVIWGQDGVRFIGTRFLDEEPERLYDRRTWPQGEDGLPYMASQRWPRVKKWTFPPPLVRARRPLDAAPAAD